MPDIDAGTRDEGMSIVDVFRWMFPKGTTACEEGNPIINAPTWPPDLFAACAMLIERTGCYTHPEFFLKKVSKSDKFRRQQAAAGLRGGNVATNAKWKVEYDYVNELWRKLVVDFGDKNSRAFLRNNEPPEWCNILLELLWIADEACKGVGFSMLPEPGDYIDEQVFANCRNAYWREHLSRKDRIVRIERIESDWGKLEELFVNQVTPGSDIGVELESPFHSLCWRVPDYIACVQPKTSSPTAGFTVRSLSHNLALLPAKGEVATFWYNTFPAEQPKIRHLNLLLVPYPYRVDGICFDQKQNKTQNRSSENASEFQIHQKWLDELVTEDLKNVAEQEKSAAKQGIQAMHLKEGIAELIRRASLDVGDIDGVVLPEYSLTHELAEQVSQELMKSAGLRFFTSGICSLRETKQDGDKEDKVRLMSAAYCRLGLNYHVKEQSKTEPFFKHVDFRRIQVKHHRWCLDRDQIIRYNLGSHLAPSRPWWEKTDIIERENLFWVLDRNLVMSSLICEDLARIDPVQQVLRAVGPNLVIALLMDGPQMLARWPSRYATVLADDPGCGVLTLTSLGMIRRSYDHSEHLKPRQIAIWKGHVGAARELTLPPDAVALVVTLSVEESSKPTIPGRDVSESNSSKKLCLSGVKAVYLKPGDKAENGLRMLRRAN